jgi:hypothetical protein
LYWCMTPQNHLDRPASLAERVDAREMAGEYRSGRHPRECARVLACRDRVTHPEGLHAVPVLSIRQNMQCPFTTCVFLCKV